MRVGLAPRLHRGVTLFSHGVAEQIGTAQGAEEPTPEAPPSPEPEPEPELEEPELPPAAQAETGPPRRRWRRGPESVEAPELEPEPPRHVRVLPADDGREDADPWEQGFDAPDAAEAPAAGEPEEQTEDRLLLEGQGRRRFRRR